MLLRCVNHLDDTDYRLEILQAIFTLRRLIDMSATNACRQLLRYGLHFHKNKPLKSQDAEKNFKQPIPNHRLIGNVGPWTSIDFSKGSKDPIKLF